MVYQSQHYEYGRDQADCYHRVLSNRTPDFADPFLDKYDLLSLTSELDTCKFNISGFLMLQIKLLQCQIIQ